MLVEAMEGTALVRGDGIICISGIMYTNDDNDRTRLISRA